MSQWWTILDLATGAVLCPSFVTASSGQHPKDRGWPWDATKHRAARIDTQPDPTVQSWNGTAWADDPAKIQPMLIGQVKADNEARVRSLYTTNFGMQKKYSRKQQEVMDYRALPATVNALTADLTTALFTVPLALLNVAQQKKKFRFAMAEAKLRGVSLGVVIGEYEAAIDVIEDQIADWEAVEKTTVRAIKAATTAAAKRAVYAGINWGWRST